MISQAFPVTLFLSARPVSPVRKVRLFGIVPSRRESSGRTRECTQWFFSRGDSDPYYGILPVRIPDAVLTKLFAPHEPEVVVGKMAYFFTTFVGAVPAGLGLALLIMEVFLKRTEALSTMLLGICIVIAVCLALVVMTPFMVLVFYKDTRPKLAAAGAGVAASGAAAKAASEPAGFDDAIPENFDEEELAASAGDEDDYGDYEGADYTEDAEGDYDEDDYDDFEDLDF